MNLNPVEKLPLITLVGPPNSGKTTLFNLLSGKNYKTVNYPGATVEYSLSKVLQKYNIEANLLDSPGIVSLIPNSPDEKVSIDALYLHPELGAPDIVIATVDASQLSRHLLLTRQLIESGFNVIIAVTMPDILLKKGLDISIIKLSEELNCDVIKIDGRTGKGIDDLLYAVNKNLENVRSNGKRAPVPFDVSRNIDKLINSYKDISRIEDGVLYKTSGNGHNINLDAANEQLTVLNNPVERKITHKPDEITLKIDRFLLHPFWGIFAFFLIMAATFTSIFWLAEPLMWVVDNSFGYLASSASEFIGSNWFGDLVSNGIITGTGSVLVFLPQILILFLILGLLEDTGYLARGAMLVDKPLSKIGLNGKSFVPMLSGFACAVPAILSTRTIPNKTERLLTIFIIPLMSCSARLPVYALLLAFLIPGEKSWIAGLALAGIYIFSVSSSVIVAALANKFRRNIVKEEDHSSFILELPAYRKPKLNIVLKNTIDSAVIYLKKAGPIILLFSLVLWFLTYFPNVNPEIDTTNLSTEEAEQVIETERLSTSFAADLGKIIQPVMTPIGMDWRVGVSLIAAFAAREVFVSSLALIFKVTNTEDDIQDSMIAAMRTAEIGDTGKKLFTTSTIIGLIIFFIFAMQCMSTVAVSKKESGGWRIPLLQIFIFTGLAYLLTFITVNGLRFFGVS